MGISNLLLLVPFLLFSLFLLHPTTTSASSPTDESHQTPVSISSPANKEHMSSIRKCLTPGAEGISFEECTGEESQLWNPGAIFNSYVEEEEEEEEENVHAKLTRYRLLQPGPVYSLLVHIPYQQLSCPPTWQCCVTSSSLTTQFPSILNGDPPSFLAPSDRLICSPPLLLPGSSAPTDESHPTPFSISLPAKKEHMSSIGECLTRRAQGISLEDCTGAGKDSTLTRYRLLQSGYGYSLLAQIPDELSCPPTWQCCVTDSYLTTPFPSDPPSFLASSDWLVCSPPLLSSVISTSTSFLDHHSILFLCLTILLLIFILSRVLKRAHSTRSTTTSSAPTTTTTSNPSLSTPQPSATPTFPAL